MNSSAAVSGPRHAPSARGGVVLVSLYSWTCITLLAAVVRFILRSMHRVEYGADDGMVLVGVIIYTGATVASQYEVNGGLGRHFSEVSKNEAILFAKSSYAAAFLQIATMACAKFSSLFLVRRVVPQTRRQDIILFGMIGFWAVFSLLTFGFQCGVTIPQKYTPGLCGRGGPLFSIIVLNMVTDVVLAAWIFPTLRTLNMDAERRVTVAVLFGARIVVVLACVGQIWGVTVVARGDDPTWDSYGLVIFSQAVTSLSLILASLPRIKRFLGVASGMSRPVIDETEIALAARAQSEAGSRSGNEQLKLTPSHSGKVTTTVVSGSKAKDRMKNQGEWHKFVSMGSKQDDHTSTSSLFDHQGGVMMHQEVTVKVEDRDEPDSPTRTHNDQQV